MSPCDRTSHTERLRRFHRAVGPLVEQTSTLASNLERDLDLDLVRRLSSLHTGDLDLARLSDISAAARADLGCIDRAFARELVLGRAHCRRFSHISSYVRTLDRELGRLADIGASARKRDRVFRRTRDLSRALSEYLESVEQELAVRVVESGASVPNGPGSSGVVGVRLGRVAVRLNRSAVRLLPTRARARYADELLDELYDLAEDGAGWWRQLACGLRQLVPGAWQIRALLRQERRPSPVSGQGR